MQNKPNQAGQLGRIGAELYPQSIALRLSLAYAALYSGRCHWARPHYIFLKHHIDNKQYLKPVRALEDTCYGGWRSGLGIGVAAQRRDQRGSENSLTRFAAQPGSRLHGFCSAVPAFCNPDSLTARNTAMPRTELWTTIGAISHRNHPLGSYAVQTRIFRRMTDRPRGDGHGLSLNITVMRQQAKNRKLVIGALMGTAEFAGSRNLQPIAHDYVGANLSVRRSINGLSYVEWDLDHIRHMGPSSSYDATSLRTVLGRALDERHNLQLSFYRNHKRFARRTRRPGLVTTGVLVTADKHIDENHTLWVSVDQQSNRHLGTRSYLTGPHRDNIRIIKVGMASHLDEKKQLKIEIIAKHQKVSSPDPLSMKSGTVISIYFRYLFWPK